MRAKIIRAPSKPLETMYIAARTCYSAHVPSDIESMMENKDKEEIEGLVKAVLNMGHWSIAEQVEYTIALEDIPRDMSHQLVRHRLSAYSQKSQRYVAMNDDDVYKMLNVTVPDIVKDSERANKAYEHVIKTIEWGYNEIYDALLEEGYDNERGKEGARSVLPNSCPTSIVTTKNLRQIANECSVRLCKRAQPENTKIYKAIRDSIVNHFPLMKNYLNPKCYKFGICDEGKKSCGMFPTLDEIDIVKK